MGWDGMGKEKLGSTTQEQRDDVEDVCHSHFRISQGQVANHGIPNGFGCFGTGVVVVVGARSLSVLRQDLCGSFSLARGQFWG